MRLNALIERRVVKESIRRHLLHGLLKLMIVSRKKALDTTHFKTKESAKTAIKNFLFTSLDHFSPSEWIERRGKLDDIASTYDIVLFGILLLLEKSFRTKLLRLGLGL